MSTAPWQVVETTVLGAETPLGGRWATSARAIVRADALAVAVRIDRVRGKRPHEGVTTILHDVPRTELRTIATVLLALAEQLDAPPRAA